MKEAGLVNRWQEEFMERKVACVKSKLGQPLTLNDTRGAFYMLGIAMLLCAVTLGIEHVVQYFSTKVRQGNLQHRRQIL